MNKASDTLKYLLSVVIYGTIGFFLHFINCSSEFVVLCRGVFGSLFILIVLFLKKEKINLKAIKNNILLLVVSGACLGFNWVFLFAGYRHAVALTSLCNYFAPILIIIISALFLNEKPNKKQLLCVIAAFIGIIFVSGVFDEKGSIDLICIIYGLLACLGFVGLVLCNRRLKNIKPLEKTVSQLLVSACVVLPYVAINNSFPHNLDISSILLLIMMGFVHTGLAYILYFSTISVLPVQTVAILGYVEPVLSVLIGALVFNEHMSIFGIVGAVLIIGSAICNEIFAN